VQPLTSICRYATISYTGINAIRARLANFNPDPFGLTLRGNAWLVSPITIGQKVIKLPHDETERVDLLNAPCGDGCVTMDTSRFLDDLAKKVMTTEAAEEQSPH
jgi:hypothetical protein